MGTPIISSLLNAAILLVGYLLGASLTHLSVMAFVMVINAAFQVWVKHQAGLMDQSSITHGQSSKRFNNWGLAVSHGCLILIVIIGSSAISHGKG